MKAMSKGKILKKLKTIKAIGYLKPDKILHSNQLSGYFTNLPLKLNTNALTPLSPVQEEPKKCVDCNVQEQESETLNDLVDQGLESDAVIDDKENVKPRKDYRNLGFLKGNSEGVEKKKIECLEVGELQKDECRVEIDVSNYKKPDSDSGTLFDPKLLAAFKQAVMEARAREEERRAIIEEEIMKDIQDGPSLKAQNFEESSNPLLDFEYKCPPGGSEAVIFYTTSLRGIRKTFEDCHSVRFLLESFRVLFYERDISMHSEYREELWRVLDGKVLPPRLFIKGRDIGGSEKILTLHEQGKFRPLFDGIPVDETRGFCDSCGGVRFVMCFNCSGSQKIFCEEDGKQMRCPKCNENGVIVCPLCC